VNEQMYKFGVGFKLYLQLWILL